MILECVVVGPLEVNCYILADESTKKAIIIDPGADTDKIKDVLNKYKLIPQLIINTHGHFDHIGADDEFNVPIYIHKDDAEFLKNPEDNYSKSISLLFMVGSQQIKTLKDKDLISLGNITLEVIHTPGHTPGGICLWLKEPDPKIIFTGDTLFYRGVGRTDLPYSSEEQLFDSIRNKLFVFSDDTVILPGHGRHSTIGKERKDNPFLS